MATAVAAINAIRESGTETAAWDAMLELAARIDKLPKDIARQNNARAAV
ncbi:MULTISPECIES: hypothetical protein [unclassified Cryobacterium]|nr:MULTISPECIES: hypothetical protein [unclassified Cryobacterium]